MTDQGIYLMVAASKIHLVTNITQQLHPPLRHGANLFNKENPLSRSVAISYVFAAHGASPRMKLARLY
jgi:hypothetical protein